MRCYFRILFFTIISIGLFSTSCDEDPDDTQEETGLVIVAENLQFAEGPVYLSGDLYFSDIETSKIYRWNKEDGLKIFRENTGRANGLCFDSNGNLIVCEGGNKRVVLISSTTELTIITDNFGGESYNEPNDVWVSPAGNIYFTDPVFTGTMTQDGEHVYCVQASSGEVIRVTADLVKPNGITGNKEGNTLYVADYGASKIYSYSILPDGTLNNRQLFASVRADGIDADSNGNLYAASDDIIIFNPSGIVVNTIQVPGTITNTCIVEETGKTLFITTHNTVYKYIIN